MIWFDVPLCPRCHADQVVKHGLRHNKSGNIQRYFCNNCSKWIVINLDFEKMGATPQVITSAMQRYFTGESFRNVQKFLRMQGVIINHMGFHTSNYFYPINGCVYSY